MVSIIDDTAPEQAESFSVYLGATSGRVGTPNQRSVLISENDDPNGVLGFASGSLSRVVFEGDSDVTVNFTIQRTGGSFGVATVNWNIANQVVGNDVSPVSGTVSMANGENVAVLTLTIAADTIPETDATYFIRLSQGPAGAARLDPALSQATLTIPANDNAYGLFALSPTTSPASPVPEPDQQALDVACTITRGDGLFGSVRVFLAVDASSTGKICP